MNEREKRIAIYEQLKKELETLTGRTSMSDMNYSTEDIQSTLTDGIFSEEDTPMSNTSSRGHALTKSTVAGRMTADTYSQPQQRGYASALMLGMISFILEAIFLAVAFLMYK